jgi:hypothetical protein
MDCPDEDTFALFLEGRVQPEQAARIERHIDGCPRCAEMAAQFGRLYGARRADQGDEGTSRTSRDAYARLALYEGLMALLNVAFTVVALPIAWWAAVALTGRPATAVTSSGITLTFTWIGAAYVGVWGPVGALAALVGALGLRRRRAWARHLAYWHALLSVPSLVLTPMAAYLLYRLGRATRGAPPSDSEDPPAVQWRREN